MACNRFTQRRRKRHEYDENWNAACTQQMGFRNGVGLTSEMVWFAADTQNDSKWTWLEGEKILTYQEPGIFDVDKGFYWNSTDDIHQIFLRFTGLNFREEFEPGVFRTMQARLELLNWQIFPSIKLDVEEGFSSNDAPTAFTDWAINITNEILPNPFGSPSANGTFRLTPLKKCHDCVDDP